MKSALVFQISSLDKSDKVLGLEKVLLPGEAGEIAVLNNHSPLCVTLSEGDIQCCYLDEGEETVIAYTVTSGYVTVEGNSIEVITEDFIKVE